MINLPRILRKSKPGNDDDLKIIRNWKEYTPDRKNMTYLMFELEMHEPGGQVLHFYKAIKLARIIRLPKNAKQSESFMSMHGQVLAAVWERNIKLLTLIANLLHPVPLGLMYMYGVQGVADTEEKAKYIADHDFIALSSVLQGTYRVLEYRILTYDELEWLTEKMYKMDKLTVIRGIPQAKDGGVDGGAKGMGGQNVNPDSQDTTEEYISGMSDKEYVLQVISSPVKAEHLERWLEQTAQEMTKWNKQLQGVSSMNFSISIPMMYMANLGASQGWSHSYTDADSVTDTVGQNISSSVANSVSESVSHTIGESVGRSLGTSVTHTSGTSQSISDGQSLTDTVGENQSHSFGTSVGDGTNQSFGGNASMSHGISQNQSQGVSHSQSVNDSTTESFADSFTQSQSVSQSHTESASESVTNSTTSGVSGSQSVTQGTSHTTGVNQSTSVTVTDGTNSTSTHGPNSSASGGASWSNGASSGTSSSNGTSGSSGWSSSNSEGTTSGISGGIFVINGSSGDSSSTTNGRSGSEGWNSSSGVNNSVSSSVGGSYSQTNGVSNSYTSGTSHSVSNGSTSGTSESWGTTSSTTQSSGWNESVSQSFGQSTGTSDTVGSSIGTSVGQVHSTGVSHGTGESWGTNASVGTGENWSNSQGVNWSGGTSHNESTSNTDTAGTSQSQSVGATQTQTFGSSQSTSYGQTQTDSYSHSTSDTTGKSWGTTTGTSQGSSTAQSIGHTVGQALGTSGTITNGSTTSMGIGPAVGYSKSYQWLDQEVKNILTLLDFQNMRLMKALRGNGAFFTDVYIATDSMESLAAASVLAKSAWANTEAMICPLQVLDLTPEEQNHLIYHFYAFSADNQKEGLGGRMESYRYSTILLSDEFAAYTHLPRISEGGIFADVGDVPKFAVPSMKKGDIYIGKILSGERWTPSMGYETPFEYRLEEGELMHGIFTGESRSGKTVAATRLVAELTKVRRKTGKRLRIVVLDPKQDWRILQKFVEPERFHFYSLGNPEFLPIKLNICKVPKNVNPQVWIDGVIEIYCRAYGLMERGKAILAETFYALYDEAGVFEDSPNWREFVPERSSKVTLPKVYERMNKIKLELEDPLKSGKGRMGNEARDAYTRVLDRMQVFGRKFSIETRLFGDENGIGIDELIGKDDVIVLESYGLESTFRNFVFGVITSGFFKYAQGHEGGFLAEDQFETVVTIEEANEVLIGSDTAGTGNPSMPSFGGQSEFERILDQAAGLGLFIFSITQKIADMPSSVIANSGLIFAGKISRPDDVMIVIRKIGREERYDDRDILKWLPRSPIGWFVCRSSRNYDFKDVEPVLVKVDPLNIDPPSNFELETMMIQKQALQLLD